jgi:hypothetical protein
MIMQLLYMNNLMTNDNNELVVCLPLECLFCIDVFHKDCLCCSGIDLSKKPIEQINPKKEVCQECGNMMWVSDLKRKLRKEHPEKVLMCLVCLMDYLLHVKINP